LPEAEVIAVADSNPDRLRQMADRFHITQRCTDFRALLADPDIEAVAVCVPAQFHVEVALAALDAGKHLFIEKPLALSLADSERLIRRATQSGKKVMVGFNLRWHRLVRRARHIIHQGILGPLTSIRTVLTGYHKDIPEWRRRRASGGGVLFEVGVHHFDLWRFLLQSEVEEVCTMSRSERWEDETATVGARMTNGVLASSVFSESACDNNEVEIYGQAGRLHLSCHRFDGLYVLPTSSFAGGIRTRLRRVADHVQDWRDLPSIVRQGGDFVASFEAEWRHFIDSIQQHTPVQCTLEDGRHALHIALAAMESAALGQAVNLVQVPQKITPMGAEPAVGSQQKYCRDTLMDEGHAGREQRT
jgi:myo-inositol 2-dehydrogenase/D-chiro-inositol 1-dehydrogenase